MIPSSQEALMETSELIGELGKHSIFEKGQSGLHLKTDVVKQTSPRRIVPNSDRSFMVNYHKKLLE